MKRFNKIAVIICFFVFSLLSLSLSAQCQWSSYPCINININLYGFPGSFPSSDSYWQPTYGQQIPQYGGLVTATPYTPFGGYYSPPVSAPAVSMPVSTTASMLVPTTISTIPAYPSAYTMPVSTTVVPLPAYPSAYTMPAYPSAYTMPAYSSAYTMPPNGYGYQYPGYQSPPDSDSERRAAAKFNMMGAASDGEYIFVLFMELFGENRSGLAILKPSGPDTYQYLSHVVLSEGAHLDDFHAHASIPTSIIMKDNLVIIGGEDLGIIHFVDVSQKDKPQLINTVTLADNEDRGVDRVLDIIAENEVLFVCIEDLDGLTTDSHYIVHALDISDPAKLTKENGILGSYTMDKDYKAYGMISTPGYLYLSGKKCVPDDYGLSIHIINSSDPKNLALVKVMDDLGTPPATEPEISLGVADGSHLFTTFADGEGIPLFDGGEFQLRIFDVSDPANPHDLSAFKKLSGEQIFGSNGMVLKDNYAYVLATTSSPRRAKVYVFDVSDLQNPDLVDVTENSYGLGLNLFLAGDDNLFLVTEEIIKAFNISNPENLPMAKTVDVCKILGDVLTDWGADNPYTNGVYGGPYGDGGLYGSSMGGIYPSSYGYPPAGVPSSAYGTGQFGPYSNPAYAYGATPPSGSPAAGALPGDPVSMGGTAPVVQYPSSYGTGQYQYPPYNNPAIGEAPLVIPGSAPAGSNSNAVNLDVNGDGVLTPADALYLFQKYLELP